MASSQKTTSKAARFAFRTLALFTFLFVIAVPWWWQISPEQGMQIRFGAPTWACTAVLGSFLVSCAAAWSLHRAWQFDTESIAEELDGE